MGLGTGWPAHLSKGTCHPAATDVPSHSKAREGPAWAAVSSSLRRVKSRCSLLAGQGQGEAKGLGRVAAWGEAGPAEKPAAPQGDLKGESRPWGWDVEGEAGAPGVRKKPLFLPRRLQPGGFGLRDPGLGELVDTGPRLWRTAVFPKSSLNTESMVCATALSTSTCRSGEVGTKQCRLCPEGPPGGVHGSGRGRMNSAARRPSVLLSTSPAACGPWPTEGFSAPPGSVMYLWGMSPRVPAHSPRHQSPEARSCSRSTSPRWKVSSWAVRPV